LPVACCLLPVACCLDQCLKTPAAFLSLVYFYLSWQFFGSLGLLLDFAGNLSRGVSPQRGSVEVQEGNFRLPTYPFALANEWAGSVEVQALKDGILAVFLAYK
jgi:hypothetical protein